MRTVTRIALLIGAIYLGGCATTGRYGSPRHLAPLGPTLPVDDVVAVVVSDKRPEVETEKAPSGEYLYSGSLFRTEGNVATVATDLATIIVQYGGACKASPARMIPKAGPALHFEITHWYSRTLRAPEKAPIVVTGEFAGVLTLYRDGNVVATQAIAVDGITSVVDMYIVREKEKEETPQLVWDAMLYTANSSQQYGYAALHAALLRDWSLLGTPQQTEQPLRHVQK